MHCVTRLSCRQNWYECRRIICISAGWPTHVFLCLNYLYLLASSLHSLLARYSHNEDIQSTQEDHYGCQGFLLRSGTLKGFYERKFSNHTRRFKFVGRASELLVRLSRQSEVGCVYFISLGLDGAASSTAESGRLPSRPLSSLRSWWFRAFLMRFAHNAMYSDDADIAHPDNLYNDDV